MNNEELQKLVESIQREVNDLKKWKEERERQQIKYPLDSESINILNKDFMAITNTVTYVGGAAGRTFTDYIGKQDNKEFSIGQNVYISYTVDISADTVTTEGGYFPDDTQVYLTTENTAPGGLSTAGSYYVINSNTPGTTFKLSLTSGGSAINITSAGTGRQFIYYF